MGYGCLPCQVKCLLPRVSFGTPTLGNLFGSRPWPDRSVRAGALSGEPCVWNAHCGSDIQKNEPGVTDGPRLLLGPWSIYLFILNIYPGDCCCMHLQNKNQQAYSAGAL